jgi:hypothetical protein
VHSSEMRRKLLTADGCSNEEKYGARNVYTVPPRFMRRREREKSWFDLWESAVALEFLSSRAALRIVNEKISRCAVVKKK